MTAEVLREAASLMRERAEAATAGPWFVESIGDFGDKTAGIEIARWNGGLVNMANFDNDFATAGHIASWHPAVALAVADWLVAEAEAVDFQTQCDSRYRMRDNDEALAVARAYLGT